ncbi:MAG: hypothetical protein KAR45_10500 [Desulfobacteraceae bacterium]|nr:hypothetical protein [Desulfobacteraceae bacterium]
MSSIYRYVLFTVFTLLLIACDVSQRSEKTGYVSGDRNEIIQNFKTSEQSKFDPFPGSYQYWKDDFSPNQIDIVYNGLNYDVGFHMPEGVKLISGKLVDQELVVEWDSLTKIHLISNDNELRLYKVLNQGSPAEDVEWSFFKIID